MGEYNVSFRELENDRPYRFTYEHDEVIYSQPYIGWPAHSILLSGLQVGSLLRDTRIAWLGDRLSSLRPDRVMSWRDVERVLGPRTEISEAKSCGIELFAPVMARLLEPRQLQEGASLAIDIESYLDPIASEMEVVIQTPADGAIIAAIPAAKWKSAKRRIWTVALDSAQLRGPIDLTLSMRDLKIGTSTVTLPGLASRLLEGIEGGSIWLERRLLPKVGPRMDSDAFERAVVSLLALGGVPAIPIGHEGPDRSPDLICAVTEQDVLLGECTVGPIAPKKIGEIRHRAADVLSRLRRPDETLGVFACIFTPSAQANLPREHLAMADQTGVIVIWRERLMELLALARADELRSQVWRRLSQWHSQHGTSTPARRKSRLL